MARSKNMNVHSVHPWWLVWPTSRRLLSQHRATLITVMRIPSTNDEYRTHWINRTSSKHLQCRRVRGNNEKFVQNARRLPRQETNGTRRVIVSVPVCTLNVVNYRTRQAFVAISRRHEQPRPFSSETWWYVLAGPPLSRRNYATERCFAEWIKLERLN